jgi:hypothetical protein
MPSPAKRRRLIARAANHSIDEPSLAGQCEKESSTKIHNTFRCPAPSVEENQQFSPMNQFDSAVSILAPGVNAGLDRSTDAAEEVIASLTPSTRNLEAVGENGIRKSPYSSQYPHERIARTSSVEVNSPSRETKEPHENRSREESENTQVLGQPESDAPVTDKANWQGFCEIESDPVSSPSTFALRTAKAAFSQATFNID